MRPLKLEVSGLTCFREPVSIDFESLALVAIEGPTGAGKSSLLDAMILALYGSVPRMGRQNLSELISHGRSTLSVAFDFEVRGTRWRVARTLNAKRGSQAILSELVAGEGDSGSTWIEKTRSSGVQEVERAVKALLGIDVAAFQQAVILPQGKFQEFLHATPGDRRKILSELLGFQIYAAMRAQAAEAATRLTAEVEVIARQLSGELASAGRVSELELELEVARQEVERARAHEEARREALGETERVAERCAALVAIDRALTTLQDREAVIEALARKVARAREVQAIAGVVTRVGLAARRKESTAAEQQESTAAAERARATVEAAEERAAETEIAATQIVTLRQRMSALDEARGRFEQRAELAARSAKLATELGVAKAKATESTAAQHDSEARLRSAQEAVARLLADAVPEVAAALVARWEAARDGATRLGSERVARERAAEAVTLAERARDAAHVTLAEAEHDRRRKEAAELDAEDALEAARAALSRAEDGQRAALLREHLHPGEACPVCEQVVATVPPVHQVALKAPRAVVESAKAAAERARLEADRARRRATEAATRTDAEARRADETGRALIDHDRAIAALEAELAFIDDGDGDHRSPRRGGEEGQLAEASEGLLIEVRFRRQLDALQAAARRRADYDRAVADARATAEREALVAEARRVRAGEALAQVGALATELAATEARKTELDASLAALAAPDPTRERATLERVIGNLERDRQAAAATLGSARLAAAQANASRLAAERAAVDAEAEHLAAEAELARTGWTVETATAAALSTEAIAAADAELVAHRGERAARSAERESLVRALGTARAGPSEVDAARAAHRDAMDRARDAGQAHAILGERLRRARDEAERADGLRSEHDQKAKHLQIMKRLADDLSPRHFQEYLLEEVIVDLVRGASERLFTLSAGRYRMASDAGGFRVVDLDHAGEKRSTDTLSGGETFLASLAMALELSDQIRAKAGRVDLDCIFIDEGFGTLDPETLETVAEAVEGLQRPGRLVGIITHVAELALRMPERLTITKAQTGSRLSVATAS